MALAVFHLAFQLGVWLPATWARADRFRDLAIYYDAALRLKHGASPYQLWPEYTPALLPSRFFYPPPFLLLTRPLAALDLPGFARIWTIILLVAFWIYAACLAKLATQATHWQTILTVGLCLDLCPDTYVAMGSGNFEPVMWMCYGLALATRFRAVPLAFATMMKLHPAWTLALVVKDEGPRALYSAAVVLCAGVGAGVWLCGLKHSLNWWPATSPVVSQGTFFSGNISLSFALLRLINVLGWHYAGGPLPLWAKLYLSIVALAAPIFTIYFSRRQPKELRYALTASATILFAPLCWSMYLPLLLAPAAIIWRLKRTTKTPDEHP